ncbi:hypothetical protein F4815DRAFT_453647 [Daldinia loculata]|uniref:uncharacterized protein n=1 Tax=Daldinia loculata TaxID=103429 RepID=UPI0020C52296|nr:uncharacterized protein F4817DRAFT_350850 [Daldinia loculata]KAI1643157.1 hypothetical protein F4817DRAFT_350850 [Daldinia loculata]KAI2784623.1 hypothetical protein F4815DRAFT_453647 [Daldinia loculata]
MFPNSNTESHSGDLSSSCSSRSSFVTILSGGTDAPDVDAGIVSLVNSLVGREVRFSEQSEEANEIRGVILHQMANLLHLLDLEGTLPPNNDDDSGTADRRVQSIPLGRATAKGWIKKLGRAWTRNSAVSSHLLRFEELYPDWDSKDNYKLARVSEMVFHDLHSVLQDLQQLFNEFPDTSDEEDFEVEDVDLLNPFLSDDENELSDDEPESGGKPMCELHGPYYEENRLNYLESEFTDDEIHDLAISRLHIDDSSDLEEVF